MTLLEELKRRNVIRVGIAYVVTSWLVIQVVETLFPVFEFSNQSIRVVVIVLAIGLVPTLLFAWAFELTSEGLKREKDVDRGALVPRPRLNLTRFHGIFAPNSRHRHKIVPRRPRGKVDSDKPLAPMNWAQRLKRVFTLDIESCPECGGNVRVIACIEEPHLIAIILAHVRAREAATAKRVARAPPERDGARRWLN